jgi:KinB signaling pathway activation protein
MEGKSVTSRNWVKLFLTTLMVGGLTTVIVGFVIRWREFLPYFSEFKIIDIISAIIWLIGMGFLFSVVSQLGFFAYLTVHRFGLGIFKSIWNAVQILLILVAIFDLFYYTRSQNNLISYIILSVVLVIVGLIVAWIKSKQTNKTSFIPALFLMIVVTIVEWVPALKVGSRNWMFYIMFFGLLSCNTYQLLTLHKLNALSERQRHNITKAKTGKINQTKNRPSN